MLWLGRLQQQIDGRIIAEGVCGIPSGCDGDTRLWNGCAQCRYDRCGVNGIPQGIRILQQKKVAQ